MTIAIKNNSTVDSSNQGNTNTSAVILFQQPQNPTTIGTLEVDVLFESTEQHRMEAPRHPVEEGFFIHDHIITEPLKLSMLVIISPLQVTWSERLGEASITRISDVKAALAEIKSKKELVTIITDKDSYENMALISYDLPRKKDDGYAMRIPLEFEQITKVKSRSAIISETVAEAARAKAGQTEANAGDAGTSSSSYDNNGTGQTQAKEEKAGEVVGSMGWRVKQIHFPQQSNN